MLSKTPYQLHSVPPSFFELAVFQPTRSLGPEGCTVAFEDGRTLGYGNLVWATKGHARWLTCAGHALAGVHSVRSQADADRVIAELPSVESVVVIGCDFGLEADAVLTKRRKWVTVIEAQDPVLARVTGMVLWRFYEAEHRTHGGDISLATAASCIVGDDRATGVRLADGSLLLADMVIVGIGIVPAVEPLLAAAQR